MTVMLIARFEAGAQARRPTVPPRPTVTREQLEMRLGLTGPTRRDR